MCTIKDIELIRYKIPEFPEHWTVRPIQKPYSKYPEQQVDSILRSWGYLVVKVVCDDGTYGLGSTGNYNVCGEMIERFFKPLIIGLNPLEIEKIWDLMYTGSIGFGRKGAPLMAISAIDIALWDIFGKKTGLPVYQLLGGKVRDKIRCYGTGFDYATHKAKHYLGSKVPMPYGPEHGQEGMDANEAEVRKARDLWGDAAEIMCDCWCGWDYMYTIKMAERLRQYNIKWIEEPLMPDDFEGYRRLRKVLNGMGIMLATGEHEHTRWGARDLIDNDCVDILQCDVEYCGGVSELKKIMNYASAHSVSVVPHCPSVPGMHVIMNTTAAVTPFMERLVVGFGSYLLQIILRRMVIWRCRICRGMESSWRRNLRGKSHDEMGG